VREQKPNAEKESAAKERLQDLSFNAYVEGHVPSDPVCLSIKEPNIADWEFRTLAILLDVIENPPGFPCSRNLTREEKSRMTAYLAARYVLTPGDEQT
jgi:hypothetical protein